MIEPPYPADTRSKGWRFELDLERVRQSDTWALASAEARPWLFMLWSEAWMQTPCGSLPQDDAITAARIGMTPKLFAKHRAILLRGWQAATDGRLYHPVISEFVVGMLRRKEAERQRKAEYRAKMDEARANGPASVPRDNDGTDTGRTPDSGGSDATGTGTGTGLTSSSPSSKKKRADARPPPSDVDPQVWADWHTLRRAKKAPVTETVLRGAISEAAKAGMTLDAFLRVWCARGSVGLQADWVKPSERGQPSAPSETSYAKQMRERYESFAPEIAAKRQAGVPASLTIDMETPNAVIVR